MVKHNGRLGGDRKSVAFVAAPGALLDDISEHRRRYENHVLELRRRHVAGKR